MALTGIQVRPYRLAFVKPLVTAAGTFSHREGWVVRVRDTDGRIGYGDCSPWPGFGSTLSRVRSHMAELTALERSELPEVRSAVACAVSDLEAQQAGVALAKWLSPSARDDAATHAFVSDVATSVAAVGAGYTALKVKVAADSVAVDCRRVRDIREAVGGGVRLRIDANGGWTVRAACDALTAMKDLELDLVEQPVTGLDAMARVREATGVRIAADEGVTDAASLEQVVKLRAADVVVLKPAFLGGVRATFELAEVARRAGLSVMVTHALESAIGRAHALHLACALADDAICGLGQPLAEDVATLADPVAGRIAHPRGPGLGLVPGGVA
ncbi:MAG: o-succinylbenzoate synthase [Myxococcota bacterium]